MLICGGTEHQIGGLNNQHRIPKQTAVVPPLLAQPHSFHHHPHTMGEPTLLNHVSLPRTGLARMTRIVSTMRTERHE